MARVGDADTNLSPGAMVAPKGSATNPTHQRLLVAAVRLFATKGFHGVGIRELAAAADLSTATLYHYMGTKERLLFQIMHDALERLNLAAETISANCPDPRDRLSLLVRMHVVTHALQREASVVVDDELRALETDDRRVIVAQRDVYEAFWADAITEGVELGFFTVPDQRVARLSLIEMCSGIARWFSVDGPQSVSEISAIYADLAVSLLNVHDPRDPSERDTSLDIRSLVEQVWAIAIPGAADSGAKPVG